jgi:hypothetical protein
VTKTKSLLWNLLSARATEDGLTDKQLKEELEEENEQRNKLGKKPLSLEEYVKIRSKRIKPL